MSTPRGVAIVVAAAAAAVLAAVGCQFEPEKQQFDEPVRRPDGPPVAEVHPGRVTFETFCAACHTIGAGVKAGPDLAGVTERRERAWIKRWVGDPSKMAQTDPTAQALVVEWKRFAVMPQLPVPSGELDTLIDYLEAAMKEGAAQPPLPTVVMSRVSERLELDPFAPVWDRADPTRVPLSAQNVTMPKLAEATVEDVEVRAVTDGEAVAFRLVWSDPEQDGNVDVARFSDAVALQLPLRGDPSPMMGNKGAPVQILYWKALWQKDVDEGFQDVQDLHPNYWTDLYWFAIGEFPYPVPEAFRDKRSHHWFVAKQAGNPHAQFDRRTPVEELVAEGFGTLTSQPESVTVGQGHWRDGAWHVVFRRPLATRDPNDFQFRLGEPARLSVALWQGGTGNVGGRKHWAGWVPLEVAR